MIKSILLAILLLAASASIGLGQAGKPLLLQQPTSNQSHIVFVFAGDLWVVPRAGGEAKQLTGGVGVEADPAHSWSIG